MFKFRYWYFYPAAFAILIVIDLILGSLESKGVHALLAFFNIIYLIVIFYFHEKFTLREDEVAALVDKGRRVHGYLDRPGKWVFSHNLIPILINTDKQLVDTQFISVPDIKGEWLQLAMTIQWQVMDYKLLLKEERSYRAELSSFHIENTYEYLVLKFITPLLTKTIEELYPDGISARKVQHLGAEERNLFGNKLLLKMNERLSNFGILIHEIDVYHLSTNAQKNIEPMGII